MFEGEWFVFGTCAAECGNVCPKVIGTGPTVLTTSWSGILRDGMPGGRSVRTPTLRKGLFLFIWADLGGFMWIWWIWVYLCLFGWIWVYLGLFWVALHLFKFIRV